MRNPKHYIHVKKDRKKDQYQNMPTHVMQCSNIAPELLHFQQVPIMQSQEKMLIPVQQSHEEQLPIQQSAEEQVQGQQELPMQQSLVQEASSAEVPSSHVHDDKVCTHTHIHKHKHTHISHALLEEGKSGLDISDIQDYNA